MKADYKKQIKQNVGAALAKILESLKISKPSKRTKKAIARVSKALRRDLVKARKQQIKKTPVKTKPSKKSTTKKKSPARKKIISRKQNPKKRTSK